MRIKAMLVGCKGLTLSDDEKAFFQDTQPWGFILFGRNIDTPQQVAALVADLKSCLAHIDVPILIDQEGGRVRRLRPPHWDAYSCGAAFGEQYARSPSRGRRMAWLQSRLMAFDLVKLGINVDCLPVLDVPVEECHDVIGDRAYSDDPKIIAEIGLAASNGLLQGGVLPVVKHIPGHGRAKTDSHAELPVVNASKDELAIDFAPFKDLAQMPLAMTAHVVYSAIDKDNPATTSKTIIDDIIRGEIGFDGLLMCDDIAMNALSGDFSSRTQSTFAAGCDIVLHCNASMEQMITVAAATPALEDKALERARAAMQMINSFSDDDEQQLREEYTALRSGGADTADPTEVGGRLA